MAACAVVLIGVVRNLDPDVILLRAAGAALVCGMAAALAGSAVRHLLPPS